jgi:hypothetical protein
MAEDFTKMTVGELLSMLDPDLPGHDTCDHRMKVEDVLRQVLGRASRLYAEHGDDISAYAFYLALAAAETGDDIDEEVVGQMTRDMGCLASNTLDVLGAPPEWWDSSTLARLDAIVAASGINEDPADPVEATATEAMEASHA